MKLLEISYSKIDTRKVSIFKGPEKDPIKSNEIGLD